MQSIVEFILFYLAKAVLHKYRPDIVGITGSVGKSSTKQAVRTVLSLKYALSPDATLYNNELGLPLTILGREAQGRSVWGWLSVFCHALRLITVTNPDYPKVLVLEFGADKPGDIAYLTRLAPCRVGVVTAISPTHLEQFGTIARIKEEKLILVRSLQGNTPCAILNADDELLMGERSTLTPPTMTYGFSKNADVRVMQCTRTARFIVGESLPLGISLKIAVRGDEMTMNLPNILGSHQVYPFLAAIAVGLAHNISPKRAAAVLERSFTPPNGRMRVIKGIKGTLIIDDSYNSSPLAAKAAIDTIALIDVQKGARRIAILGDMRELGSYTEEAHLELGRYVADKGIDIIITVGIWGQTLAKAAREQGMDKSSIFCFTNASKAGVKAQEIMKQGDVVLVKGSQNTIRLERTVKEIMAEPERASELLVRQGKEWGEK